MDHAVHSPQSPEKGRIVPKLRGYQKELFEQCKDNNMIVYAPTGSGKTWVCSAVIQHVLQRPPKQRYQLTEKEMGPRSIPNDVKLEKPKNLCIFLVNRIPLVSQQGTAIVKTFQDVSEGIKLAKVSSQHMASNKRSSGNWWDNIYMTHDVVVMIDTIFNQLLEEKLAHITEVDLIVVDECHHCLGGSALNLVFLKHYHSFRQDHPGAVGALPQVLGLTASPGSEESYKDTLVKTQELLANLGSGITMVCRPENLQEMNRVVSPAVQSIAEYCHSRVEEAAVLIVEHVMGVFEHEIRAYKSSTSAVKGTHQAAERYRNLDYLDPKKWGRGTQEYNMHCANMSAQALINHQRGFETLFEVLRLLSESVIHIYEIGLLDTVADLFRSLNALYSRMEADQLSLEEGSPTTLVASDLLLFGKIRATLTDMDKLQELSQAESLRVTKAHLSGGVKSLAMRCPKMGLLFRCIRDSFHIFSVQGMWALIGPAGAGLAGGGVSPAGLAECGRCFPVGAYLTITPRSRAECSALFHASDGIPLPYPQSMLELGEETTVTARLRGVVQHNGMPFHFTSIVLHEGRLHASVLFSGCPEEVPLVFERVGGVSGAFRGIIFTQTKKGVQRIFEQLQRMVQRKGGIWQHFRPERFVGHGSSGSEKGMTGDQQEKVMKKFRDGHVNLLIATNVAEEGIDIPVCNVVVRYDAQYSVRSLVQSRGRARARNSLFFIVAAPDERTRYERLREQEHDQERVVRDLMERPPNMADWDNLRHEGDKWAQRPQQYLASVAEKQGWERVYVDLTHSGRLGLAELKIDLSCYGVDIRASKMVPCTSDTSLVPASDKERQRREKDLCSDICRELYTRGLLEEDDALGGLAPAVGEACLHGAAGWCDVHHGG